MTLQRFSVVDLLVRGRAAPAHVSALEAVMGADWAEVEFDRARKAQIVLPEGLVAAHRQDLARFGGGGTPLSLAPGRRPQAVVKMIRKGGAGDLRGLRAQMAYLSRNGALPLHRSERYMGLELDAEGRAALERGWHMPPAVSATADRTTHFLVSFPEATEHGAAERAGRAWADELFGSGDYGGDAYDYYTAFHTDRAHPHIHVVVYRRGLDNGAWLKVSRRSDLNYDTMRAVLVEVAGREGIALEATPRLARGLHDRPVPDAEYRRAAEAGRAAEPPAHTNHTAVRAAAALLHYARKFASDAQELAADAPQLAANLRRASKCLEHGQALTEALYAGAADQDESMSARVDEKRDEVRQNFEKLERRADEMEDGAPRMRALRQIAELRARSAPFMGNAGGVREFTIRDDTGRYQGIDGSDPAERELKLEADARVRAIAERYGTDGEATVERYSGGPPSRGLAVAYAAAEARERDRSRAVRGDADETPVERQAALARMHDEIGSVYREARSRAEREAKAVSTSTGRQNAVSDAAGPGAGCNATKQREREQRDAARKADERRTRERDGGRGL